MDKESIYELQKIDCNCNDCIFMQRDTERFKQSLEFHKNLQESQFNKKKENLIEKAKEWLKKDDLKKYNYLLKEANKMRFQFDKKGISIQYGKCLKFEKDVSFIPNHLQLDTQDCFKHRKDS